jgi:chemotaxis signal transduction protein
MSARNDTGTQPFVLLRLGDRRFAVASSQIAELVPPSRVFRFPHNTENVEGVILRRGRIVPVCDVAEKLIGKSLLTRRFYLIVVRNYGGKSEWVGLPVTGECELISAELSLAGESDAPHVSGWISHAGDVIEVLNIDALTPGPTAAGAIRTVASEPELQEAAT